MSHTHVTPPDQGTDFPYGTVSRGKLFLFHISDFMLFFFGYMLYNNSLYLPYRIVPMYEECPRYIT